MFYQKRRKIINVFTLTFKSHDVKIDDVITFIVRSIRRMNNDIDMIINEEIMFIYVFKLTLINNMFQ